MLRPASFALGAAVAALGALLARESRRRRYAERFSAAALESLLRAIDANDPQTGAHVRRVATYSLILADAIGVSERERRIIELTALFHDVGKIHEALFDIVHEPRRLTRDERRRIRQHPARSAEVLAPIAPFHPRLAEAVFAHHERWDGQGYPRCLRGRHIPLPARVVAIADTFDAVTYRRRYRDGRPVPEALDVIHEGRGTQFDPELVDLLMQPPMVAQFVRAHDRASRRGWRLPARRDTRQANASPKVRVRWRSRTAPPASVQRQLARVD